MGRSSAIEGLQFAHAAAAASLSNADASITELDRAAYGWPRYVGLVIITGDVAATAVLDVFSLHGDNSGSITPAAGNLLVSHPAVAADATANDSKEFRITYDALNGPRYFDAIVSNNVAANFVINSCFWVMSDAPILPDSNNFGPGSPTNG